MATDTVNRMSSHKQKGMSLIELMIVVAIVGILAAIAYPSYENQVRKSNRTEAKVELERRAGALEKCYTRTMDYTKDPCKPIWAAANTSGGLYSVEVTDKTDSTYTLTATAIGRQAKDTTCKTMILLSTGERRPPKDCW